MADKEFLDHLIRTQEKISDEIKNVRDIQSQQEVNLREHMYRTELNEKAVSKLSEALEPIKTHVSYVEGGLKLVGIVSLIVGILLGLRELFQI